MAYSCFMGRLHRLCLEWQVRCTQVASDESCDSGSLVGICGGTVETYQVTWMSNKESRRCVHCFPVPAAPGLWRRVTLPVLIPFHTDSHHLHSAQLAWRFRHYLDFDDGRAFTVQQRPSAFSSDFWCVVRTGKHVTGQRWRKVGWVAGVA